MSNITIGRYQVGIQTGPDETGTWSGWIEGNSDDGKSWIMYLDGAGRPALYWPECADSGAVIGDPIKL